MAKFNEMLSNLMEKAGLTDHIGDERLKKLFQIEDEIPDEFANPIQDMISMKAAHNNIKLKTHFVGEYLRGSEKVLENTIRESGLSEEEVNEILTSSQKFTERTIALAEALKKKAANPPKKGDDTVQKYNELQKELETLKKTHIPKEQLDNFMQQVENERYQTAINELSSSFNWSEAYDIDTRPIIFNQLLDKKINELGAKIVLKDKKPVLVQKDNPELEYFDNSNKPVNLAELAKNLAVEKKLIAASGSTTPTPSTGPTPVITTDPLKTKSSGNDIFSQLLDKSIDAYGVKK